MRQFDDGGFTPPTRDDLLNDDSPYGEVVEEVLHYLTHQGELIYLDDRVLFTDDQLSRARKILGEHIYHHGPLTPSVARELLGSTRRYVIPLLEYFDRTYFTRRMKEGRVLFRKNILVE